MHVLFHVCEAPVKGSQEIRMEPSEGCLRGAGPVKRRLCENREETLGVEGIKQKWDWGQWRRGGDGQREGSEKGHMQTFTSQLKFKMKSS